MRAGKTYLVGEKGPELFKASSSGDIVANDKLQSWMSSERIAKAMGKSGGASIHNGGHTITINVTGSGSGDEQTARNIRREIERWLRDKQREQHGLLSD